MLILYDYKKLNLEAKKCSINKPLYKEKNASHIYKKAEL